MKVNTELLLRVYGICIIMLSITAAIFFSIFIYQIVCNMFFDGSYNSNETLIILLCNAILHNLICKDICSIKINNKEI